MLDSMTSTKQLTVNAAFLKEIKDDNLQLKALWDKLVPMISHRDVAGNHWQELVRLLSALRDQLALHFSLEEAYGYFDNAVDIEPRLSLAAEELRNEHCKLFTQIRDLADAFADVDSEQVESGSSEKPEKLVKRFATFRSAFELHEERELKLILASLDDDIGVGD